MAREWVGPYSLHYEWYNDLRDEWVAWTHPLGHCLGRDEAISKAINHMLDTNLKMRNAYIRDGFGNNFKA